MDQPDFRGTWAGRIASRRDRVLAAVDGALVRARAAYWGVTIGRGCTFYGLPAFRRAPGSSILIGDGCILRSAPWSNLIGLNRPCTISTLAPGAELRIGDECGLSGATVAAASSITLGRRVLVGANVVITDTDWHGTSPGDRWSDDGDNAAVSIEDDVWLGLNVIVLKGVTIGRGSIVSAGSVVTADVPEGVVAGGVPARVLREL